jgi:hypothetical protein
MAGFSLSLSSLSSLSLKGWGSKHLEENLDV